MSHFARIAIDLSITCLEHVSTRVSIRDCAPSLVRLTPAASSFPHISQNSILSITCHAVSYDLLDEVRTVELMDNREDN